MYIKLPFIFLCLVLLLEICHSQEQFYIYNKLYNRVLDSEQNQVTLERMSHMKKSQLWSFEEGPNNSSFIVNIGNGKYLDIADEAKCELGHVVTWHKIGHKNQLWYYNMNNTISSADACHYVLSVDRVGRKLITLPGTLGLSSQQFKLLQVGSANQ